MRNKIVISRVLTSFLLLAALLASFMPVTPAFGHPDAVQNTALQMDATAAFDGNFKYGEWIPVWIQLENNGPDLEGELQARMTGGTGSMVFAAPASLPSGARKRIPLYILPNNFSHTIEVQLVSEGNVVVSDRINVTGLPNINYLVGIAAADRGAISLINSIDLPGMRRTKTLVDLPLSDLPERAEGLQSFDTLIFNDIDTSSLTPEQKTALESWVYQGGRLVIGGGAGAQKTAAGLPESLLSLNPTQQVELEDLSGLAAFAGAEEVRVPGPFVAARGDASPNLVLAWQEDLPLLVEIQVGEGTVTFSALDLSISPFDAWSGASLFWETLLGPGSAYPDWIPQDMSPRQMMSGQMTYALSNLPALDLPSIRGLAVLLSIYVILVGPVNYLVLRWLKRLQWAWVTIPVITLAFSAGAFSIGYLLRGNDLILNKITIAQVQAGGAAKVTNYYGLFSPAQTSYQVEVSDSGLLSPLNQNYDPWGSTIPSSGEVIFVQGTPAQMRGLSVNQWSMQSFMTEGTWASLGEITSDLRFDGGNLVGSVTNNTNLALEDAVIIIGNQFFRLDTLEAGEKKEIRLEAPSLTGPDFGMPLSYRLFEKELNSPNPGGVNREIQLKQSVLDSLFQWGGGFSPVSSSKFGSGYSSASSTLFIGWFKDVPADIHVSGRVPAHQGTGVLFAQLDYAFPESGPIKIPEGFIPGSITEIPVEGGLCGSNGIPSVYMGRGTAVFEFQVPETLMDIQVEELTLSLTTDGGWNEIPVTSIYNWQNADWVELEELILGVNVISQAENYYSQQGKVKIQISSEDRFGGGCYFMGLGLTGER